MARNAELDILSEGQPPEVIDEEACNAFVFFLCGLAVSTE
jgi:hypothetical protein